jgi:hypothetical protein
MPSHLSLLQVSSFLHSCKTKASSFWRAKKKSTKSPFSASTPHKKILTTLKNLCLVDELLCLATRRVWIALTDSTISPTTIVSGCSKTCSCSLAKAFYLKTSCSTSRWRVTTPRSDLPRQADTRVVFCSSSQRSWAVKPLARSWTSVVTTLPSIDLPRSIGLPSL